MGFFSWECPCCNVSIRSHHAEPFRREHMLCTLVLPDRVLHGAYDGYGRIDLDDGSQFSITEDLELRMGEDWEPDLEVKFYHTRCWEKAGRPEFKDAKWSRYAADQGFFFDDNDIG